MSSIVFFSISLPLLLAWWVVRAQRTRGETEFFSKKIKIAFLHLLDFLVLVIIFFLVQIVIFQSNPCPPGPYQSGCGAVAIVSVFILPLLYLGAVVVSLVAYSISRSLRNKRPLNTIDTLRMTFYFLLVFIVALLVINPDLISDFQSWFDCAFKDF